MRSLATSAVMTRGVFMGVVYLACIGLGIDNVIWSWRVTPWGLGVNDVFYGLKWSLHLLRVSIASAIPDFAWSLKYHPDLSSFKRMASISPNLGVFCLYGRALLATGFMFACGLATTLGVAVYCNTAIRRESVRCALVAYGAKYVRLLATTLGVAVCCNTTIRTESVRCVLMICGQVFIYCSTITLSIVVRCNTSIRAKSVRCMLAVIRLLPICGSRLR